VISRWPDAVFVEVGPLKVLHNLLDKKWHKNAKHHTDIAEGTAEHLQGLIAELQRLRADAPRRPGGASA